MVEITPHSSRINKAYDGHSYSRSHADVVREFEQLKVAPINTACNEWSLLARNLGTLSERIRVEAAGLEMAWDSEASADAQQHLRVAQATAEALADQSMTMARATDFAASYAEWYQANVPGTGLVSDRGDSRAAVNHLVRLLGRYNEVIGLLPTEVQAQYARSDPGLDDFVPDPGGYGSQHQTSGHTGSGEFPGAGGEQAPGGGAAGVGWFSGSDAGHGNIGGADPLGSGQERGPGGAGGGIGPYDPHATLAGGGPAPGGIGGAPGGGLGSAGVGGGPGGGGLGVGPGGSGSGTGGATAGLGPSGSGGAGGAGGSRAAGGTGGAPMHGGRGGDGDDEERERSTWLIEDEDVWGGNTDVPPPVIGG